LDPGGRINNKALVLLQYRSMWDLSGPFAFVWHIRQTAQSWQSYDTHSLSNWPCRFYEAYFNEVMRREERRTNESNGKCATLYIMQHRHITNPTFAASMLHTHAIASSCYGSMLAPPMALRSATSSGYRFRGSKALLQHFQRFQQ
jgi:hypothetical protein